VAHAPRDAWVLLFCTAVLASSAPLQANATTEGPATRPLVEGTVHITIELLRVIWTSNAQGQGFALELSYSAVVDSEFPPMILISSSPFFDVPGDQNIPRTGFSVLKDWERIGTAFTRPTWAATGKPRNLAYTAVGEDLLSFPKDRLRTSFLLGIAVPKNSIRYVYDINVNYRRDPAQSSILYHYVIRGTQTDLGIREMVLDFSPNVFVVSLQKVDFVASHELPSRSAGLGWVIPFSQYFPVIMLVPGGLLLMDLLTRTVSKIRGINSRYGNYLRAVRVDGLALGVLFVSTLLVMVTMAFTYRDAVPPWVDALDTMISGWFLWYLLAMILLSFIAGAVIRGQEDRQETQGVEKSGQVRFTPLARGASSCTPPRTCFYDTKEMIPCCRNIFRKVRVTEQLFISSYFGLSDRCAYES